MTLVADAIRHRDNPRARAIVFRRKLKDAKESLLPKMWELYPSFGAAYKDDSARWVFPSGMSVQLAYCDNDNDIFSHQGSEYDFIAFDESTQFPEFPVRYMLSRLRSTDPQLQEQLRVRLATNPGNLGNIWHRRMFMGQKCSHCELRADSKEPWRVYSDARWPSDGAPVLKTTCYIPGNISDHRLLGADYERTNLASLPARYRCALRDGCWSVFEGQYFDCWNTSRCVIDAPDMTTQWWWPHWVGIDYGFNISAAAAYLFARSEPTTLYPRGRTLVAREYVSRHEHVRDFARSLWRHFIDHTPSEGRPRVLAWFLSPDAWQRRGDDYTLAAQIERALRVNLTPASNDRAGAAMLIYTMLSSQELVISAECEKLIEAIPSRVHDPREPDKVRKVPGDELDDCFDALRYGVYSSIGALAVPAQLQHSTYVDSDLSTTMLGRRIAGEAIDAENQPVRYL